MSEVKPLNWVPTHGGKWFRAETAAGVYEVRANDRDIELAKQKCFERHCEKVKSLLAVVETKPTDAGRSLPYDRDTLGRFVREAWVRWAETQPSPKPSWLAPYDELSEPDKEADRQIGEALARWTLIGEAARLSKVEEHLKNIEATADAISSPQRMSIIRKQALLALAILGQAPPPAERMGGPDNG